VQANLALFSLSYGVLSDAGFYAFFTQEVETAVALG
jgi:hypothetical protein